MEANSPESHLTSAPQLRFGKIDDLASRVGAGIAAARKYLFSQQHQEGYWCGELEADTTLESDYILLHTLLGTGNPERFQKAGELDFAASERGRRMEHLRPWAIEYQRIGESLFRSEAGRLQGRSSRAGCGPARRSWNSAA